MWIYKKKVVPETNATKEVEAVQLWYVEWHGRTGIWHTNLTKEMEAFPSEADAKAFAESLRAAFRLVKNTSDETVVNVRKN